MMQGKQERWRLDRLLARMGLGSRREAGALIRAGRVTVAGEVRRDPSLSLDPAREEVAVDGAPLAWRRNDYLMLHKPAGLVTAMDDPRLPTVGSLLPPRYVASGVAPVGRLDRDTTGLLLLTNDGQLAHRLLSPRRHVPKVYRLTVDAPLTAADERRIAGGIALSDFTAKPAVLERISDTDALLTLTEGKFHQVKRMMHALGREVLVLHRVAFGPLQLDEALSPGAFRPLTEAEEQALRAATSPQEATDA